MSEYLKKSKEGGKSYDEITTLNWKSYNVLVEEVKNEPEPLCAPSSLAGLDKMTGGFEPGRLYVVGAPPKQGKTLLAMSLLYRMSKIGVRSLIFSYEVGWRNIVRSFMKMEQYDGKEPGTLQIPMFIPIELHREGGTLQLMWLREAIQKAKSEGVEFIVIDYLHFLIPYKVTQNFSIVVGNVVQEIKRIAVETQMPIFLIVAMKKLEGGAKPTVWDIRDSSMIMHVADDIMIMYRLKNSDVEQDYTDHGGEKKRPSRKTNAAQDPYTDISVLSLEMSRKNGASGGVHLYFNGAYFEEIKESEIVLKHAIKQQYDRS